MKLSNSTVQRKPANAEIPSVMVYILTYWPVVQRYWAIPFLGKHAFNRVMQINLHISIKEERTSKWNDFRPVTLIFTLEIWHNNTETKSSFYLIPRSWAVT